jgi:hypothetical protein
VEAKPTGSHQLQCQCCVFSRKSQTSTQGSDAIEDKTHESSVYLCLGHAAVHNLLIRDWITSKDNLTGLR